MLEKRLNNQFATSHDLSGKMVDQNHTVMQILLLDQ